MPDDMAQRVAEEARRLLAVAQAEPHQSARGQTKTVRFAKGSDLLAWYESYASASGNLSTNGAIVLALMTFRAAVERGERKENHP
jgi:hypothetical protein